MTYFVYDHAQHCILGRFAVGPVFLGSPIIKTDHRIFHTVAGFHALSDRIWIRDREFRITFYRMSDNIG